MNRCDPDAYVLGPDREPPEDPTEYDWESRLPKAGCNRLWCPKCKADVKVLPSADPKRRLYACPHYEHSASEGCTTHDVHFTMFGDPEPVDLLPWTCGGHPSAELPLRFDEQTIEDRATLADAIVDATKVDAPNGSFYSRAKVDVVLNLYRRTKNGSLERIVPDALMNAMTRSAPDDRARLVDMLAMTLFWEHSKTAVVDEMLDRLRTEALRGVITSEQLYVLTVKDVKWLVEHVDQLLAKFPERAGRLVAWGGRALLATEGAGEEASRKIGALGRKAKLDTSTLIAAMNDALGVRRVDWESRQVLDAVGAG
jgi:hypothetical protein